VQITTDHPESKYGVPIFLDDDGEVMEPGLGFAEARNALGLTAPALARLIGKSPFAIHNWEQGRRKPDTGAIYVLRDMLAKQGKPKARNVR